LARPARRLSLAAPQSRHRALIGSPVALLLASGLLASCSSQAASLGNQACGYVSRAVRLRTDAASAGSRARSVALRDSAQHDLELAAPIAAQAAGADPTWQALAANLEQINRVPTSLVLPAIRADCEALTSPGG
jgi:hypothetical protein